MTINNLIELISPNWYKDPTGGVININLIAQIEKQLRVKFSDDYIQFILWSNGGEGYIGNRYFCIWPIQQIEKINQIINIKQYLPNFLLIGGNTGSEGYALEFSSNLTITEQRLYRVSRGDLDIDTSVLIGESFLSGLINMYEDPYIPDE
jgi:hypothetical protein